MPTYHPGRCLRHFSLILAIFAAVSSVPAFAQDLLQDRSEAGGSKQYLITMAGRVGKENFQNVTGVLELFPAAEDSLYPYIIVINGWPTDNGFNTFAWNSLQSDVTTMSTRVQCHMTDEFGFKANIHFYYLSPILFKRRGSLTQHEHERIQQAKKVALPTRVYAKSGDLNLNFLGTMVTGEVSMNGYDSTGHEYVQYYAHIEGSLNRGIKSRHRIWKND